MLFFGPIYAGRLGTGRPRGAAHLVLAGVYAIFVAGAFVFVHVLAYRSVFEYGSLCPWCMVIWLVTIPLFWTVLGWTLADGVWGGADGARRIGAVVLSWLPLVVVLDYLVIAVAAQLRLDVIGSLS